MTKRTKLKKPLILNGKKITHIEMASDRRISKYGDLPYEFVKRIFGVNGGLFTDLSSVYDFDCTIDFKKDAVKHNTDKALKKIKRVYGVDVSKVKGLTIVGILKKILSEQEKMRKASCDTGHRQHG